MIEEVHLSKAPVDITLLFFFYDFLKVIFG